MRTSPNLRITVLLCASTALAWGACTSTSGTPAEPSNADAHRALLADLATNVVLPTLRDVDAGTATLASATTAWAGAPTDASLRTTAQEAWRKVMAAWQRAELLQVGPAGIMGEVAGGEDLRDRIYSWPLSNPCRVDQETVASSYSDPATLSALPLNVHGLDAVEYVLFAADGSNQCAANSKINSDGSWAALGDAVVLERRAAYAAAAAWLVRERSKELLAAWEVTGKDFAKQLRTAGKGSTVYATAQEALNSLSDALFYIDTETKDMKLGEPAGIQTCVAKTCPDELESRFANASKEHVLANLQALQLVMNGGADASANGFDDLLRAVGAADVADKLSTSIAAAIAAGGGITGSLRDALDTSHQAVLDWYASLKVVTDILKTDFVAILDLELPNRADGDND